MPTVHKQEILPYPPEKVYGLVNDVLKYPEFVPHCVSSQVLSQTEDEIRASLTFAKGSLHKSFSTCNRLSPHKMIEMRLLDGPFSHLEGFWRFDSDGNEGTSVQLDMDYEFSNKWMGLMFGPVFTQVANKLVEVFCERAREVLAG